MPDDTRIDRWLCAVRLVKTRPMATQLCDGGHLRVNGNPAKPSTKVRAGDVVHALIAERERIVEVVRPNLDDVVAGYGTDVDGDLIRAWRSLRCLSNIRWLVEHGFGSPEEFPEVAVLNKAGERV